MRSRHLKAFAVAAVTTAMSCVTGPAPRGDIAVIESGAVHIDRIDRVPVHGPYYSAYELRPGGHTIDVTVSWSEGSLMRGWMGAAMRKVHTEARSLCVKARGGRRYRIKNVLRDKRMYVFIVDLSTGQPPVTPCGPDEDDD